MASGDQNTSTQNRERIGTTTVLRAAALRMRCAAVALVTADGGVRRLWARSDSAKVFAESQLKALKGRIIEQAIERRTRVLSNRVRREKQGEIVAKILAVPIIARAKRPVGALVGIKRPTDPDFDSAYVQEAMSSARMLSKRMISDRDSATGLLTWSGFTRRADRVLNAVKPTDGVAVLYGNIDRLHIVNNTSGMKTGDRVIAHAALVIRRCLTPVRSVACRLSGDRFVVLLPLHDVDAARTLAEKIRATFEVESRRIFGSGQTVSVSWGVVASEAGALRIETAIADAELACRAAKDRGRNRIEVFERSDVSMLRRHDDLDAVRLLRDALHSDRIVVYAQPIVPLQNLKLPTSYELLIRLLDNRGNIVEPAAFMSAAQRYQLLPDLDRAMASHAFRQLRAATPDGGRLPFSFGLNLSGPTISAAGFDEWLLGELERNTIPPNQLTIEITEAAAAANLAALQQFMSRMSREGVKFALDDFGTGVNSLSQLKDLSVSTIKLDGSYVRDVETNTRSEALVRAIVQLADSMSILTVAEYVDSVALRGRIAKLGVQFGQGYAIGRAEPLADLFASDRGISLPAIPKTA